MAKSTKSVSLSPKTNRLKAKFAFVFLFAFSSAFSAEVLIDQTVAVVGKEIFTLHDLNVERVIAQALDKKSASESSEQLLQLLIRRSIITQHLSNIGLLIEVPKDRLAKLKDGLKGQNIPENELENRLKSRIQAEIFMEEQLPARITVTDQDVRAYYEAEKNRRFLGKPFESVKGIVRADLRRDRVQKEFQRWFETEMHRTEVTLLPLPK